jgi:hypothetical protein
MFNSKLFTIFNVLALLALAASVAFQVMEMQQYGLDKSLMERFFPSDGGSSAPADDATKPAEEAKPADKAE